MFMSYRTPGQEEFVAKVGSTRPTFRRLWEGKNPILRLLAPFEYLAAWFFFLFHNMALFRFAIEGVAAGALVVTVIGVLGELQQRKIDRGVRVATLFAQIAQTHSLPEGQGLRAVKATVEALARENVRMEGIDLTGASLTNAVLVGADLRNADLSESNLHRADLHGAILVHTDLSNTILFGANLRNAVLLSADCEKADLRHADLSNTMLTSAQLRNADLRSSNLRNADLDGANLSGANLSGAKNLTATQLVSACAEPDNPPRLSPSFSGKKLPICRLAE